MPTLCFNFRAVAISKDPFKSNAIKLRKRLSSPDDKQTVVLVPEPNNRYDRNAIVIMAQTPMGRVPIGYVPSRRFCLECDPLMRGRGYKAYDDGSTGLVRLTCPDCSTTLEEAVTEKINPLLLRAGSSQLCHARFIGGTEGRENIGAIVECTITVPDNVE